MGKRHYIIYCDESAEKGRYYSHFYGGALIEAVHREAVNELLARKKISLNLHKEVKWTYITENYESKYIDFIDLYFDLIKQNIIKLRIMFTQNIYNPLGLTEHQLDNQYFLLYYQLIKHAFGLRYCNPGALDDVSVTIYLDDVPDSAQKFAEFRAYLHALCHYPVFKRAKIFIPYDEITDVKSHQHVILQGLDIILGAMQFRLNDLHKVISPGQTRRGKRTRAKERVYKHINMRIRDIYPGFNIGTSTGMANGESDRWEHPYRHWLFIPSDHKIDLTKGKSRKKEIAPP